QADRSNPADKVAPPLPWQDEAREEPPLALEGAVSLGELHEEITAYRHRERVLSAVPPELLRFDRPPQWHDQACRHVGLTGLLACTEPGACHAQCGAVRTDDPARLRISAGQPASEASPFTRV
ncbi:MAG TPA: hypothetical protein VK913_02515, partial [Erythrobacter sp.]|nr:hypothetical protein [Erythrobacter sp.]